MGKSQTEGGSRQKEQGGNGAGRMAILSERFTIREGRRMEEELTQGWGQDCAVVAAFFPLI